MVADDVGGVVTAQHVRRAVCRQLHVRTADRCTATIKGKGCRFSSIPVSKDYQNSRYSITERRVPELIPVLGSQPAGDASHKPGGRLPLLAARPAVTLATLNRAATNFAP